MPVRYPAFFWGVLVFWQAWWGQKPLCSWEVWRQRWDGVHCNPSPGWSRGEGPENFWLYCILNSSKHCGASAWTVVCLFLDELIFMLLGVLGSEFGIPNWCTGFKIALDMHWMHLSQPICVVPFETYETKTLSILVVVLSYESCFAYYSGKFGCFVYVLFHFRSVISCWRKDMMRILLKMWKKPR